MELNPNHAVTRASSDQWHKIAALLLSKFDLGEVIIDIDDINRIEGKAIVIDSKRDGLHVRLTSMAEAERIAKHEGGLPS